VTTVDSSCRLLAGQYVGKQVKGLARQLEAIRTAGDPEHVHQARVALRRLQVALRMFRGCFPRKKPKVWRKAIRRLLKALSPVRDRDVQVGHVRDLVARMDGGGQRPGLARLALRLEQQREALQADVVEAVEQFEDSLVLDQMRITAGRVVAGEKDADPRSPVVFHEVRREMGRRLEKVLALQDCLDHPDDKERCHAMRVEAKRLRYALEICRGLYDGALKEFVGAVKELQRLLGDLHDCDMWIDRLQEFLAEERSRTVGYFGHARSCRRIEVGIRWFLDHQQARRTDLFMRLTDCWRQAEQGRLWTRFTETLDARAGPSALPPKPSAP